MKSKKNRCGEFDECSDCASPFLFDYEEAGLLYVCCLNSRCKRCPNFTPMKLLRSDILYVIYHRYDSAD